MTPAPEPPIPEWAWQRAEEIRAEQLTTGNLHKRNAIVARALLAEREAERYRLAPLATAAWDLCHSVKDDGHAAWVRVKRGAVHDLARVMKGGGG